MQLAFGFPFMELIPRVEIPPLVNSPIIERVVPARTVPARLKSGIQPAGFCGLSRVSLNSLQTSDLPRDAIAGNAVLESPIPQNPTPQNPCFQNPCFQNPSFQNQLPRSLLPFTTLQFTTPNSIRGNLKPLGAIAPRNEKEKWLQVALENIVQANAELFNPLTANDFRITYDKTSNRLASVDLDGLEIRFGPQLFALTQDDEAITAILCHELAHILLGHHSFSTPYPEWVQSDAGVIAAREKQETLKSALKVHDVAARYQALTEVETLIRTAMLRAGVVDRSQNVTPQAMRDFVTQGNIEDDTRQRYNALHDAEAQYQTDVSAWQAAVTAEKRAVDAVMGEPGASENWTEAQADNAGFRLFLARGGRPEDYIKALVLTLSRKDPGLSDYTQQLFDADNLMAVPPPERGFGHHPTPRWRVYNIVVRELHLHYPKEYRELLQSHFPYLGM